MTPTSVPDRFIIINEVAWAGTIANPSGVWIELYNPNSGCVDLTNWHLDFVDENNITVATILFGATSTPFPTLTPGSTPACLGVGGQTTSIPSQQYFLLERGNDCTVSDVPADQIFNNTISNSAMLSNIALRLFDASGNMLDSANDDRGSWPAGKGSPSYCSMERTSSVVPDGNFSPPAWFTNNGDPTKDIKHDANNNLICGTPKMLNWAYDVVATPAPTPTRTPSRTVTRTRTKTRTPTRTPIIGVVSSVVINEFLPQPRSDWNGDGVINTGDEFIEIKNLSISAISLSGWRLDDQEGDSSPFSLPSVSIEPGGHLVYFASETHLLLSSGGETVRLYRSNGQISDAFTYGVVQTPNQSWCRFPDGFNFSWVFGCQPTPQETNLLAESNSSFDGQTQSTVCLRLQLHFPGIYTAECTPSGQDIWSRLLWNLGVQTGYPRYIEREQQEFIVE